jgi:hypothetical protein
MQYFYFWKHSKVCQFDQNKAFLPFLSIRITSLDQYCTVHKWASTETFLAVRYMYWDIKYEIISSYMQYLQFDSIEKILSFQNISDV